MTKEECISDLKSINATGKECIDYAIKALEQQPSDDCVSRQAMLNAITEIDNNINMDIYTNEVREIVKELPPVTPTQCIATVRFSKEDLREICKERIEIECTHGTCKDCKHWKDSDGVYRRGIGAESKCPVNSSRVFEGTFCCADFEKRGSENRQAVKMDILSMDKLEKIEQIIDDCDLEAWEVLKKIKEVLKND